MTEVLEERICTVATLADHIVRARMQTDPRRSVLVAISGIDGAGKGHVAGQLEERLREYGYNVAVIGSEDWLDPPEKRFTSEKSGEHFYRNTLRFDDLFNTLIRPLRDRRSIRIEADFAEETAGPYRRHLYEFEDVDIILLEGVFLLKWEYFPFYDISVWVDCSFSTALDRAVRRGREGLPSDQTIWMYNTTYFPAQRIHFQLDNPKHTATFVLCNDHLLERRELPE